MTLLRALAAAAVLAGVAAASAPAEAQASFNCARARTFVEKAICNSATLSAKDRRMSKLYFEQLNFYKGYGDRYEVRAFEGQQRTWLAQRNRCQTTRCLHVSYDNRIRQLEQLAN